MVEVVILLGRAGTGKTTLARWLAHEHGARIVSLAEPLKSMAREVMGFEEAQLYGTQAQKEAVDLRYGFSARWFLQRLGTEGVRKYLGEDVWAMDVERRIMAANQLPDRPPIFVVDDARFESEARYLRRLPRANYAIRSRVVKLVPDTKGALSAAGDHASETEVDRVDPSLIDAHVPTSRARGVAHMLAGFRAALPGPWSLAPERCERCWFAPAACQVCHASGG